MENACRRHLLQEGRSCRAISDLSASEQESDWPTVAIGQRVDLVVRPPRERPMAWLRSPFPPEAERCALTAELSISTWAGGPPVLANAWKQIHPDALGGPADIAADRCDPVLHGLGDELRPVAHWEDGLTPGCGARSAA